MGDRMRRLNRLNYKQYSAIPLIFILVTGITPAFAGPVIIGGDDLTDHGFNDGNLIISSGACDGDNKEGWLYIQNAVQNLLRDETRPGPHDVDILVIGSEVGDECDDNAGSAVASAALKQNPPATLRYCEGPDAITTCFNDLTNGNVNPRMLYISGTGAGNDIDSDEGPVITANANKISSFVASGGGLLAHGSGDDAFGWIPVLLPGFEYGGDCDNDEAELTPAGQSAFPLITNDDIRAGPCHDSFSGNFGGLEVLAVDSEGRPFIVGLAGGEGGSIEEGVVTVEQIPVPDTTVDGKHVFEGLSFPLDKDYGPEDFFCINATGTVDLASGQFTANAAGVIVSPETTNTGHHPGQTAPGPSGYPYASLLIGNEELGFVPYFTPANSGLNGEGIPGPTTLEEERTMGELFDTGAPIGTPIEFRINDSNNGDNSGQFEVTNCLVQEPSRTSNGGDNQWDTRPTFGISHEDRFRQVVENGFRFNNNEFMLTDNHHTDFAEQSVEIGTVNSFSATVYADKKLKVQEFLFGIPQVGESHLAELGVEVWYDFDGNIEDVKVVQKSDVIDADTVSVSHEKTKCLSIDPEPLCDTTTVSMKFLEPLQDKVMAIKAIDFKNRDQRTYLNEGFDISGESLNPMLAKMIPSNVRNGGLLQVTQVEKYSPYWVAEDGRMFEMNSFGSFQEINQKFERFQDKGNASTRMHSGFGGIIDYEKNRATQVFDATKLISELPDSFGHHIVIHDRISEEMKQNMVQQEQIAKGILEQMDKQNRYY